MIGYARLLTLRACDIGRPVKEFPGFSRGWWTRGSVQCAPGQYPVPWRDKPFQLGEPSAPTRIDESPRGYRVSLIQDWVKRGANWHYSNFSFSLSGSRQSCSQYNLMMAIGYMMAIWPSQTWPGMYLLASSSVRVSTAPGAANAEMHMTSAWIVLCLGIDLACRWDVESLGYHSGTKVLVLKLIHQLQRVSLLFLGTP